MPDLERVWHILRELTFRIVLLVHSGHLAGLGTIKVSGAIQPSRETPGGYK